MPNTYQTGAVDFDFDKGYAPTHNSLTEMWGHSIEISDATVGCPSCNTYKKVPEIVKGSDELTQVVYKMYMLGKFVGMPCKNDTGLFDKHDMYDTSNITNVQPDSIYFSRDSDDTNIWKSDHYF